MEKIISKKEFDELMNVKGETMGLTIKPGAEFIRREEGEEGLNKLEETLVSLNPKINYRNIKSTEFYPLGLVNVLLVVVKRLFNYEDEKFRELGKFSAKFPLFVRALLAHVISIEKMVNDIPKAWRKYYTVGNLKMKEFNKEKRYVIYRLEDFPLGPLYCKVFEGLLSFSFKMVIKKPIVSEETKCVHRGDEYHEFLLKW